MMMNGFYHGWGMGFGWLAGIIFLIVLIWLIVKVTNQTKDGSSNQPRTNSALDILKERYAWKPTCHDDNERQQPEAGQPGADGNEWQHGMTGSMNYPVNRK